MTGIVKAICISETRGVVKSPVSAAELKAGHGIVGDGHAGNWHRQVSLLSVTSIDKIKRSLPELPDGAFAENVVVEGLDLLAIGLGGRLRLGADAVLEITQVGKECHDACAIRELTGDCVMPREGIFCRVLEGGRVQPGDAVAIEERP